MIQDQTVTFHDDIAVDHNAFPQFVPVERSILSSATESRTHSIKDFLGRPKILKSGTLSTAQVQGDVVAQVDLPQEAIFQKMFAEKLSGFLNFRATVNIRFQANA